jgi:alpha-amylase
MRTAVGQAVKSHWSVLLHTNLPASSPATTPLACSHPFVRKELAYWAKWLLERYSAHLLRMDASSHMQPSFFPYFANETKMPLWLETIADPWDYEQARQGANFSYQSFGLYNGTVTCFAPEAPNGDSATGCYQISLVRKRLQALGADTRLMGSFVENHDTDRFLSARDNLPAYRNALAYILLSESIPIM